MSGIPGTRKRNPPPPREILPPPELVRIHLAMGAEFFRAYMLGECSVFVAREPRARLTIAESGFRDQLRWHLSISHRQRYPTWDEIKTARYELVPRELTMAMVLPPPEEFVNADDNCFHLWQVVEGEA